MQILKDSFTWQSDKNKIAFKFTKFVYPRICVEFWPLQIVIKNTRVAKTEEGIR